MINIVEIEEGILIEAGDCNVSILQVYNDIITRGKNLSRADALKCTSNIIGSMIAEGLVRPVRSRYRREEEDLYAFESERDLTPDEMSLILKEPARWDALEVFSPTEVFELAITDRGMKRLDQIRY
ncbi:MAG: hypothetical protein JW807_06790 [Spirochaetes bacterium]|nr:hypothetical protein [Spirochaetota bacterium]